CGRRSICRSSRVFLTRRQFLPIAEIMLFQTAHPTDTRAPARARGKAAGRMFTIGQAVVAVSGEIADSVIGRGGVVQNDAEQSVVNLEAAVVLDEPQLPELVHEEIHA